MASPQLENGYTRISNELYDKLIYANFNGVQSSIIHCIIRNTYGFQKKSAPLSLTFISNSTNHNKINIQKELTNLIERKIVIVISKSEFNKPQELTINKNFDDWVLVNRLTVSKTTNSKSIGLQGVSQMTNSGVSQMTNQKRNIKENIKEIKENIIKESRHKYGEYKNVLLSDIELEKLKTEFPNDWEIRIENLSGYIASTGKTYKNYLATIRVWARKDKPTLANKKQYGGTYL